MQDGEYVTIVAVSPPDANGKSYFSGTSHVELPKFLSRLRRSKHKKSGLFVAKSTSTVPGSWKKEHFCRQHLAVLDDIGTKIPLENFGVAWTMGAYSYVIESSPENFQIGYILEEPIYTIEKANRFEESYVQEAITDVGIKGPMHLVRLPGGYHQKSGAEVHYKNPFEGRKMSPDEILTVFDLDWAEAVIPYTPVQGPVENFDLEAIHDPVLEWLARNDMIIGDIKENGWASIRCPWEDEHTEQRSDTGYNGLGYGSNPMMRAFHCFHSHNKNTIDFLDWVSKQPDGPDCSMYDPIPFLQQNYAVIEDGSRIAATHYVPAREWAIWELKDFNMKFPQRIQRGKTQMQVSRAFIEDDNTKRYRGTTYRPSNELDVYTSNGVFYNMFSQPMHPATEKEPATFLGHCEYLIPNEDEREFFYDWLATHVQKPGERLPGVLIIGGFGVGKSWLNSMIAELLGVANVSSASFQNLCNPQQYDNWLVEKQLIVIEEAKDTGEAGRYDVYENIKPLIDTREYRNYSANMKYGKVRGVDIYANFLIFSNHNTPMIVPTGDRRLFVIDGARDALDSDYYKKLHSIFDKAPCMEAARLWSWLEQRKIANNVKNPFMTPAKAAMIQTSKSPVDEAFEDAMEDLPGDICTEHQLHSYIIRHLTESNIEPTMSTDRQIKHKFREMPFVDPMDPRWQLRIKGERLRPRIVRNQETMRNITDLDILRDEVLKNGQIALGSKVGLNVTVFKK